MAGRNAYCFWCLQGYIYIAVFTHLLALARRLVNMLVNLSFSNIIKYNYYIAIRIMLFLEQGKNKDNNDNNNNNNNNNKELMVR